MRGFARSLAAQIVTMQAQEGLYVTITSRPDILQRHCSMPVSVRATRSATVRLPAIVSRISRITCRHSSRVASTPNRSRNLPSACDVQNLGPYLSSKDKAPAIGSGTLTDSLWRPPALPRSIDINIPKFMNTKPEAGWHGIDCPHGRNSDALSIGGVVCCHFANKRLRRAVRICSHPSKLRSAVEPDGGSRPAAPPEFWMVPEKPDPAARAAADRCCAPACATAGFAIVAGKADGGAGGIDGTAMLPPPPNSAPMA